MNNDSHLLNVDHLSTYFYTFEGTAKAVDDVSFFMDRAKRLALSVNQGVERA